MTIRPAAPGDAPTILRFIRELAQYEREPGAVLATEADLLRDGWGLAADGVTPLTPAPPARFTALIAEYEHRAAGFALYFITYSTWMGHHGIQLEDIYVTPEMRGLGIGRALLTRLAQIAVAEGCPRWSGMCCSGTSRRSPYIVASARRCSPNGASCGSRVKPCTSSRSKGRFECAASEARRGLGNEQAAAPAIFRLLLGVSPNNVF